MRQLITVLVLLILVTVSGITHAQEPPPPPSGHGQNGGGPMNAPIDGGMGILVALGLAYAGKQVYKLWIQKIR